MKSEFINPFLGSCTQVFEEITHQNLCRTNLSSERLAEVGHPIAIFFGVAGPLWGQVVYGMDEDCAKRTAAVMMGSKNPMESLDEIGISAIAELANIMTGRVLKEFESIGVDLIMTPPTVLLGECYKCLFAMPTITITFNCNFGDLYVNVGLIETNAPPPGPIHRHDSSQVNEEKIDKMQDEINQLRTMLQDFQE